MVHQNRQRGKRRLEKADTDPALVAAVTGDGEEEEAAKALPKERTFERSSSLLHEVDVSPYIV